MIISLGLLVDDAIIAVEMNMEPIFFIQVIKRFGIM